MPNVVVDSELITQTIPASPLTETAKFYAVKDENGSPMLFSVGEDGILYLTKTDRSGQNQLHNLSTRFGISTQSKIIALAVTQDLDSTIYLVFAERPASGTDISHIVKPLKPEDYSPDSASDFSKNLFLNISKPDNKVSKIQGYFLGNGDDRKGYPLLIVSFISKVTESLNINNILVDTTASTWSYDTRYTIPENADASKPHTICVANLPNYRGLFILYALQQQKSLIFLSYDTEYDVWLQKPLTVPNGAASLATFTNKDGFSDLLVGGEGLHHFLSEDCTTAWATSTEITPAGEYFSGLGQLVVAISEKEMSVWSKNKRSELVYQRLYRETLKLITNPVPLLSRKEGGGSFSALLDNKFSCQKLFILGTKKQMTMLEQNGRTNVWKKTPFVIPSTNHNEDVVSYTSRVTIKKPNGRPALNVDLLLSSTTVQTIDCNGEILQIDKTGSTVTTDEAGVLIMSFPSNSVSSPVFTLSDLAKPGRAKILTSSIQIDPAQKVRDRLSNIKSGADLRNAKRKDGTPLLKESSSVSNDELDKIGSSIGKLNDIGSEMKSNSQVSNSFGALNAQSKKASDWDIWHFLSDSINVLTGWDIKPVAEGIWKFIVKIAGKVFDFVMETLEHVYEAVDFLLRESLGIDMDDILSWLGSLLGWDDILETHDLLVGFADCALVTLAETVRSATDAVDHFIAGMEEKLAAIPTLAKILPADVSKRKTSAKQLQGSEENDIMETAMNGTEANWLNDKLTKGAPSQSMNQIKTVHGEDLLTKLGDIMTDVGESIGVMGSDLFSDLLSTFDSEGQGFDIDTILSKLGRMGVHFLQNALRSFRKLVRGIMELIEDLILFSRTSLLEEINIPLITPLYKKLTKGRSLTVMSLIAMMISVPASIITRIISGKKLSERADFKHVKDKLMQFNYLPLSQDLSTRGNLPDGDKVLWNSPSQGKVSNSISAMQSAPLMQPNDIFSNGDRNRVKGSFKVTVVKPPPFGIVVKKAFLELLPYVLKIISFGSGVLSLIGYFTSIKNWYVDGDLFTMPPTKWIIFKTWGKFFAALATIPIDCLRKTPRPAVAARALEACCNIVMAICNFSPVKQLRAVIMVLCSSIRFQCVGFSVIMECLASDAEYPGRAKLGKQRYWVNTVNRFLIAGTKVANGVALGTNGTEPISAGCYLALGAVSTTLKGKNVVEVILDPVTTDSAQIAEEEVSAEIVTDG